LKPKLWDYEIIREGDENILRIDCEKLLYLPSIEDNPTVMAKTIEILAEAGNVTKIIFTQKRDFEYDFHQTQLLAEISKLYNRLLKQKTLLSYHSMGTFVEGCTRCYNTRYTKIQNLLFRLMKTDPLGSYVEVKRLLRKEKINLQNLIDERCHACIEKFISILKFLIDQFEKTALIKIAKPNLAGYKIGDRTIYRQIFSPTVKPDFMFTKLMASYPTNGEELDNYSVGNTEVTIFSFPNSTRYLYHLMPPEFTLTEEKYEILDTARRIMAEHKPKRSEFVDPKRMREVFYNVGHDLIEELVEHRKINMREKEIDELTEILVRYTVGFGLIEVLLNDEKIQDISINSPLGQIPMFVVHQDYGDCFTNITPTNTEAESWASKLRMISGRPLDEANQILDTELLLPSASARVSAITQPLDPYGLAFSFRRHRDKPWTLPLFMNVKMLTPLAAGLLSFLVDGTRTMLIAGTRSSGKTSLLGSLMVEIMRRYRVITIEDTLELPTTSLRKLGFNIQPLKVAGALAKGSAEVSATEGIRSTLRLGDSALIVGEVRSDEAKSLYEAMRVGAAANIVAGTIHAESPYGVFDRVVNDIGVPKTSFKATDIVVVANPIRTAGGINRVRRVTQITEVRKFWQQDPILEKGFVDLMKYEVNNDKLEASDSLINGESDILKNIAGNIKEFAGNWDAIWSNIQLRAKTKETLVKYANKIKDMELLEAPFVIKANDMFHLQCDLSKKEIGHLDNKRIFFNWNEWLKREVKKKNIK